MGLCQKPCHFHVMKMAGVCEIIMLRDVEDLLMKTYLHAKKSGKVCCSHDDCLEKAFILL